jgi:hypothetical protein
MRVGDTTVALMVGIKDGMPVGAVVGIKDATQLTTVSSEFM